MSRLGEAERHRHQAEELRAKAELMADEETRAQYLRMAEAYEMLANSKEQLGTGLHDGRAPLEIKGSAGYGRNSDSNRCRS